MMGILELIAVSFHLNLITFQDENSGQNDENPRKEANDGTPKHDNDMIYWFLTRSKRLTWNVGFVGQARID